VAAIALGAAFFMHRKPLTMHLGNRRKRKPEVAAGSLPQHGSFTARRRKAGKRKPLRCLAGTGEIEEEETIRNPKFAIRN
jgi:hypothetical protein